MQSRALEVIEARLGELETARLLALEHLNAIRGGIAELEFLREVLAVAEAADTPSEDEPVTE